MTISRRSVLLQGSAIGAGLIATNLPGITALAQGQPPQRRSLGDLQLNDPIIQAWRDGVGQLKQASGTVSWANFAAIHGNARDFNLCPHGNWYFLPWHRAFLLMYERAVRQLTGHADFALPYWDWTADRQLPAAFTQPTFNGQPNPLYESQRDMSPTDSLPDEIVGQPVITTILGETPYETFGTSRPNGQDSLAQSWINCEGCGVSGTLEATPHNNVHNIVGGLMGGTQSALDPIFMMHHCNIDRIWAVWNVNNQNSNDPLWTGMTFQNNFYNPDGTFYSPVVSDLYTPENLGYTYGLAPAPATVAAPAIVALGDKITTLFATPNVSSVAGVKTFVAQNAGQATAAANKPLDIAVEVDRNLMAAVARRTAPDTGGELLDFNKAREVRASGTRALAFIRDIAVARHKNTLYRVFIDCDYLSRATPISDPHYVGTFGIFGDHGGHGGRPAAKPSIAVDLTRAIKRVYGSATEPSGRIRLQILPVPNSVTAGPAGTATPGRIEVAFVSA
ncbi:MAG: tyrosinase family protein [Methylocella sp.]